MSGLLQPDQQLVQKQQLTTAPQQFLQSFLPRVTKVYVLRRLSKIAVVATLLQLHHNINEAHRGRLVALHEGAVVLGKNVSVVLLLHPRHVHPQNLFYLGWQVFLNVLLDTSNDEGLQDLVEAGVATLLGPTAPVLFVELAPVVELEWHDEVEQGP